MQSAKIVLHIEREMALHLGYCKEFGLSKEEVECQEESQGWPRKCGKVQYR